MNLFNVSASSNVGSSTPCGISAKLKVYIDEILIFAVTLPVPGRAAGTYDIDDEPAGSVFSGVHPRVVIYLKHSKYRVRINKRSGHIFTRT